MAGTGVTPFSGSNSKSPTGWFGPATGPSHPHGVGGFLDNLAGDVKNAVEGLPMGLINTVEHPLQTVKTFGTTTWHEWSPLFHGDIGKFAHNTFDHPLAPLLDVMTVFTLGAGAAANVAKIATSGERLTALEAGAAPATFTEKLAALKAPKGVGRIDPTDKGRVLPAKQLSTRAGRRLVQEGTGKMMLASADHLPKWFVQPVREANFTRAFVSDNAHRHFAAMTQFSAAIKAGEMVAGTSAENVAARANVLAHVFQTLMTKAPHRAVDAHAPGVGTVYGVVKAAEYLDVTAKREFIKAQKSASRWDNLRAKHAEGAHSVTSLRNQLQTANDELRRMHSRGSQQRGIPQGMPGWDKPNPTAKQLMNGLAQPRKDAEANVTRLTKALDNARLSKTIHNKAVSELDAIGQRIHGYNTRVYGDYFKGHAQDYTHFQSYLGNLAKHTVITGTSKRSRAAMETMGARDANGHLILVPIHTAAALGQEGARSSAFVKLLYEKPTNVWKRLQVGFTPRTIVNNGVGNWAMFLTRTDPISAYLGIRDSLRYTKGDHAATEFQNMVSSAQSVDSHWMNQFKHELGQDVSGPSHMHVKSAGPGGGFKIDNSRMGKLSEGVYPLVHKFSDAPVRRAALASFMHGDRGVMQLAKENRAAGLPAGKAFDRAVQARLVKDPALVDRATQYSRSVSGDYVSLNPLERHIRNIVPFYLWDKHIVKTGFNIMAETPGRVAFLQSVSSQGVQKTEALLGTVPDFLKGAVPLSSIGLGGIFGGSSRTGLLSTTGLNPFNTIGDLAKTAQAGFTGGGVHPGEALLGQLFPAIPAAAEWAAGKSLLTGATIKPGAPIPYVLGRTTEALPFMRLIKTAVDANPSTVTKRGNQTMYAKNASETLSSILGVPIKEVNMAAATAVAAKQGPVKKKSKGWFPTG